MNSLFQVQPQTLANQSDLSQSLQNIITVVFKPLLCSFDFPDTCIDVFTIRSIKTPPLHAGDLVYIAFYICNVFRSVLKYFIHFDITGTFFLISVKKSL